MLNKILIIGNSDFTELINYVNSVKFINYRGIGYSISGNTLRISDGINSIDISRDDINGVLIFFEDNYDNSEIVKLSQILPNFNTTVIKKKSFDNIKDILNELCSCEEYAIITSYDISNVNLFRRKLISSFSRITSSTKFSCRVLRKGNEFHCIYLNIFPILQCFFRFNNIEIIVKKYNE